MALVVFLLFGAFVIVFGLGFVTLTLRHHRSVERQAREQAKLAQVDQLAAERLP